MQQRQLPKKRKGRQNGKDEVASEEDWRSLFCLPEKRKYPGLSSNGTAP